MKQRILILANSDSGLYDFRKELLHALVVAGYEVVVSVPKGPYKERMEALGCRIVETTMDRRGMNPIRDLKLLQFYHTLLKREKPMVVLTYTIKPNIYGGFLCSLQKIPYLSNVTGLGTSLEKQGFMSQVIIGLYRIGLRKAVCVFFQNEYNRQFMINHKCAKGKTVLLPGSGVNLTEYKYCPYPDSEQIMVLTIGRIMDDKGSRELLEVAPKIVEKYPNVTFGLLGTFELENQGFYEPIIEDLQQQGVIRYYGYQENASDFMEKAQVIVHPSYHEGMSNVLLESSALGRPIIACNIPGCKEIVQDGINGILCKPRDADSLEKALEAMLNKTREERECMGQAGRYYVEQVFDRTIVVNQYLTTIKEIEGWDKR